ncbi:glycoside hydrolase family 35 protein [Tieghemostelium lacteum]|uniref:beta-galactosidase n=1 Tax=Tieghemostelium lacteum TaxID=361077 RepID=A0A152A932_TIELA|nr:glycoside hydrolase family 35 protein [Tieghemostelium lacteum]|eukprot:KYR02728.1 glycoside hydrolase family 35 protein [Tieghemostelium lacteum]
MKEYIILFVVLVLGVLGKNVTYDHRSLIIDGERKLLISGSIHYPRSTPSMWRSLLQNSKDGGIDVIETYVFWNLHEPQQYQLESMDLLLDFLQLCQEMDLYVTLRIGPYICAEWNYGGFPIWLRDFDSIVFRDQSDPFQEQMTIWMNYINTVVKDLYASNNGPIILVQVENEYYWVEQQYGVPGRNYAEWAINFAQSLDTGIPWIMCAQDDIAQAINTCNGFYCHEWIQNHWNEFYNQPPFFTELWSGWFQKWGEAVPHRPVQDLLYSVAMWFAYGGSLVNYYMYHGGSNFQRSTGQFIATTYNYDAPLDEYGFTNEPKYSRTMELHAILHKYSDILLSNEPPTPQPVEGSNSLLQSIEYQLNGNSLVFLCNSNTVNSSTVLWNNRKYMVSKWSVLIVYNDQEVFDTSDLSNAPSPVEYQYQNIVSFDQKSLVTLSQWKEPIFTFTHADKVIVNSFPYEQINITKDESDYLFYQTVISGSQVCENNRLVLNSTYDSLHIFINGDRVLLERFYSKVDQEQLSTYYYTVPGNVNSYNLTIVCETMGLENYALHMESYSRGLLGQVLLNSMDITNNEWSMKPCLSGENMQLYQPYQSSTVTWTNITSQSTDTTGFSWYKIVISNITYDSTVTPVTLVLNMTSMSRGLVWVNGNQLGRYWTLEATQNQCNDNCVNDYEGPYYPSNCRTGCNQPSQSLYHVPIDWVYPYSINIVTVFEEDPESTVNPTKIQLLQIYQKST